jgi:hypothetical protein
MPVAGVFDRSLYEDLLPRIEMSDRSDCTVGRTDGRRNAVGTAAADAAVVDPRRYLCAARKAMEETVVRFLRAVNGPAHGR